MKLKKIGYGMSRTVFLSEDGLIVKKPNYDYYIERRGCGSCTERKFQDLMNKTAYDANVKKVKEILDEGRHLYSSARNTFVEYMLSLVMTEEEKKYFAVCLDIRVRRSPHHKKISVVGFYENAYNKSHSDSYNKGDKLLWDRTGYNIEDLHSNNYVNGIIVDYAAIE